ncbi:hypothetical protein TrLO_g3759 [Triparma laevis f. longispina]|uniref:Uncharacterized protein n=1 Tax=Triparma laevis f. longispina TaxID=1714387 RepID=A0A9W7FQZ0_9STRA|nr:hypothetical protein TrLO_g3759 [Triparma laevis f. longispina]
MASFTLISSPSLPSPPTLSSTNDLMLLPTSNVGTLQHTINGSVLTKYPHPRDATCLLSLDKIYITTPTTTSIYNINSSRLLSSITHPTPPKKLHLLKHSIPLNLSRLPNDHPISDSLTSPPTNISTFIKLEPYLIQYPTKTELYLSSLNFLTFTHSYNSAAISEKSLLTVSPTESKIFYYSPFPTNLPALKRYQELTLLHLSDLLKEFKSSYAPYTRLKAKAPDLKINKEVGLDSKPLDAFLSSISMQSLLRCVKTKNSSDLNKLCKCLDDCVPKLKNEDVYRKWLSCKFLMASFENCFERDVKIFEGYLNEKELGGMEGEEVEEGRVEERIEGLRVLVEGLEIGEEFRGGWKDLIGIKGKLCFTTDSGFRVVDWGEGGIKVYEVKEGNDDSDDEEVEEEKVEYGFEGLEGVKDVQGYKDYLCVLTVNDGQAKLCLLDFKEGEVVKEREVEGGKEVEVVVEGGRGVAVCQWQGKGSVWDLEEDEESEEEESDEEEEEEEEDNISL